jgi:3-hydroxybutyryl-CoA dehydrogenase
MTTTLTADKESVLVDRFTYAAIAEAGRLLDEGIASAKDIDLAMRAGAGFAAGPLEMADTIGLDAVLEKLTAMQSRYGDNYQPSATLSKLVAAGALGKKTGRGFLEYR